MTEEVGNQVAPEGSVWVCIADGKRSRDKYGQQPISPGWDASCVVNAMLCSEKSLVMDSRGRVLSIKLDGSR